MGWGEAAGGAMSIGASIIGARSAKKEAAKQRAFEAQQAEAQRALTREQFGARKAAYEEALGRAGTMASTGEQAFLDESAKSPEELEAMRQQILSGQSETLQKGAGQLSAELSKGGMRGGQAMTQMRRGIGEMTTEGLKDITQLETEDALRRAAERRAYLQAKAQTGQAGAVQQGTF